MHSKTKSAPKAKAGVVKPAGANPGEGAAVTKVIRQVMEKAQAQLGPAAYEAAWAEGQQMTMEQAIALATEDESEGAQLSQAGPSPA